jgi:hypothetical protein
MELERTGTTCVFLREDDSGMRIGMDDHVM